MKLKDIANIQELNAQQAQILKGGARDTGRGGSNDETPAKKASKTLQSTIASYLHPKFNSLL